MAKDPRSTPAGPLTVKQATDAIVGLINAQARSPRHDEIAAVVERVTNSTPVAGTCELGLEIQAVIAEIDANNAKLNKLDENGPKGLECQGLITAGQERLERLTARLPLLPRSFAELFTLGEVGFHLWEKERDGSLSGLDPDCTCFDDHLAARLILAVTAMGGRRSY